MKPSYLTLLLITISSIVVTRSTPLPLSLEPGSGHELWCTSWRFAAESNNLAAWKTVPAKCGAYVSVYMTDGAYRSDHDVVAEESSDYARSLALTGLDARDAWVFDVDETLLSNLPYYRRHGFGLEVFNGSKFDKWVSKAMAPAIKSSLKLYEEVVRLGFKTILLTGRSETQMNITADNLKKAGYHGWDKLILRGTNDQGKTAMVFKSAKRDEIVASGYRILGNSGDQWSDLLGSSTSNRSFKLPNPMYYIP